MPLFSVIIPTYNRAHRVVNAVESVLAQSFTDYECFVIDDGSTDETYQALSPYQKRITYIPIPHGGVSKARNAGIELSRGQWMAFLDSDDIWLPKKLQMHVDYIQSNESCLIHQTDEVWMRKGKYANPMKKHKKKEGDIFDESLHLCLVSPSAAAVHRSVFDNVGLFDELMPVCEDYDLWLRTSWQYHIGLIPQKLIVKYGGHDDQLSTAFWGMDRFRVYSICKLLAHYGHILPAEKYNKALDAAFSKCFILLKGSQKRLNAGLVKKIEEVLHWLTADRQSTKAYHDLVTE